MYKRSLYKKFWHKENTYQKIKSIKKFLYSKLKIKNGSIIKSYLQHERSIMLPANLILIRLVYVPKRNVTMLARNAYWYILTECTVNDDSFRWNCIVKAQVLTDIFVLSVGCIVYVDVQYKFLWLSSFFYHKVLDHESHKALDCESHKPLDWESTCHAWSQTSLQFTSEFLFVKIEIHRSDSPSRLYKKNKEISFFLLCSQPYKKKFIS